MGEHFRFIEQGSRSNMRDHEARLHAWLPGKKRRKTFIHVWIDQALDPALTNAHEVSERDRGIIEREGERCAMEIAA